MKVDQRYDPSSMLPRLLQSKGRFDYLNNTPILVGIKVKANGIKR